MLSVKTTHTHTQENPQKRLTTQGPPIPPTSSWAKLAQECVYSAELRPKACRTSSSLTFFAGLGGGDVFSEFSRRVIFNDFRKMVSGDTIPLKTSTPKKSTSSRQAWIYQHCWPHWNNISPTFPIGDASSKGSYQKLGGEKNSVFFGRDNLISNINRPNPCLRSYTGHPGRSTFHLDSQTPRIYESTLNVEKPHSKEKHVQKLQIFLK